MNYNVHFSRVSPEMDGLFEQVEGLLCDALAQSEGLSPEQSEMAVSVIAVCRHSEKLLRANEVLSIVVTSGALTRPPADEVGSVSEAQKQPRPCRDQAQAQASSARDFSKCATEEALGMDCRGHGPCSRTSSSDGSSEPRANTSVTPSSATSAALACSGAITLSKTGTTILRPALYNPNGALRPRSAPPTASSLSSSSCANAGSASINAIAAASAATNASTKPDISVLASAVAASKLGLVDQLSQALTSCAAVAFAKDAEDRTCLHYAAGYGHEECVSLLLEHRSDTRVRDANGDVPLHFAAIHGHPMCAYNITKACPSTCLARNYRGQTPVEVAVACERGEVLNAMLLACAGDGSAGITVQAMRKLLASGAVPDTWAPNGSSALMLAAAANGTEAMTVLLEAGATLELQDALGRSALMFAAGNCAKDTLVALLDAGACISQRDRRGRNVLDYAPAGSEVRRLLQARLDELEAVANKLQADLLASLGSELEAAAGGSLGSGMEVKPALSGGGGGKQKKKQQSAGRKGSTAAATNGTPKASPGAAPTDGIGAAQPTGSSAAAGVGAMAAVKAKSAQPMAAGPAQPASESAIESDGTVSAGADSEGTQGVQPSAAPPAAATDATFTTAATVPTASTSKASANGAQETAEGKRGSAASSSTSAQSPQAQRQPDHGGCNGGDDHGDDSEWQTVSSYKCATKARQQQQYQQQQHYENEALRGAAGPGTGFAAMLSCSSGSGTSATAAAGAWGGGGGRQGRGVSTALAAGRGAAASGRPTQPQGSVRGHLAQANSGGGAATTVVVAASSSTQSKGSPASVGHCNGSATGQNGPTPVRRAQPSPPLPSNIAVAATATAAPVAPMPGFKAALLGLETGAVASAAAAVTGSSVLGSAPMAATAASAASKAADVHLDLPPIAVQNVAARVLTLPRPPPTPASTSGSGVTTVCPSAMTAVTTSSASTERKPAWGAVKLGVQLAAVTSVGGCSPRSYPPLSAATANADSSNSSSGNGTEAPQVQALAAKAKTVIAQAGASAAFAGSGPWQPLVSALATAVPQLPAAPPPTPAAAAPAAEAANPLAPPSCVETCSAAAVSMAPSMASLAESEISSTGLSTCSSHRPCGGASPRSFGHDWTRPSPVDVLLQAAIAAASGGGNCGRQTGDGGKRLGHSKCSSAASSSCLSFDIAAGAAAGLPPTPCDLAPPQQLQPTQQQSETPCLGVSHLGGTEVPPPIRRARGEATATAQAEGISLVAGIALPPQPVASSGAPLSSPSMAVGSPGRTSGDLAAAHAGQRSGCMSGGGGCGSGGSAAAANGGGYRSGSKAAAAAAAGGSFPAASEVARLKADNEVLQRRLRQMEQRHSQELAAVFFDAEAHEAAVVERAIAQERLRITANLLAIGLCPEAILAVITPPGHGLDLQQLLAAELSGTAAAGLTVPPSKQQQQPVQGPQQRQVAAAAISLPATLDVMSPTATPAPAASSASATTRSLPLVPSSSMAAVIASGGMASLPSSSSVATAGTDPTGSCRTSGSGVAPAAAGAGCSGCSSSVPRSHHSSCESGSCVQFAGSGCYAEEGGGGTGVACTGSSCAATAGVACPSVAGDCGGGGCSTAPARPSLPVSAAIAIPGVGNGSLGFPSAAAASAAAARSESYRAVGLDGFGSPGGVGSGCFGGIRGSLGSGCGLVGSLSVGLGLGLLPSMSASMGVGEASGCGLTATLAAEAGPVADGEEQEDGEMDLPACGDISALLAMSDDDM
ncbi:hypothetical protein VOLCADRAFT_99563 [Volvox carteri f. nagariensis]|uniref:Uncharacterized protein n=1 Tax=Volvox carteri f. nagariensis TaxID=3068 RepID=D8UI20_VOLCA|nr:uncharacterized protein VOLCADRAFT_99563 [Volvox carteri f. nagariensis]EFJ40619.1 hypothetical protein VOLCADRAFT_99563 [Volvox carteri f. nagariensis]|eukprot:XP_002958326.1 hypothetical protein VOLCADRAFT_99563 [Volvox carteri f. nagariensis]